MPLVRICLVIFLLAMPVRADVPKVVSDIAPIQSLVAMVMQGVGTPDMIVTAGSSPHGFALRPSQARALQAADLVVWMGPELTPWLAGPIETLAAKADRLELLEVAGTHLLSFREKDQEHEAGHDHGGHDSIDPHAWLNPDNALIWLDSIAEKLAQADPERAETYYINHSRAKMMIRKTTHEVEIALALKRDQPYVTYHDAYQYFETRFGLVPIGAVTASDATSPGPAGLARLREKLADASVTCAFSEPQFDPGLLRAASGRDDLKIIPLDPMGYRQEPGPTLYTGLLQEMARAFASCPG